MCVSMGAWAQVSTAVATSGKSYVIAAYAGGKYYALPQITSATTYSGTEVTVGEDGKVASADGLPIWTLTVNPSIATQFYVSYKNESKEYFLYKNGTGNTNYNIKGGVNDKNYWTFTKSNDGKYYNVVAVERGTNHTYLNYYYNKFQVRGTSASTTDNNNTSIILLEVSGGSGEEEPITELKSMDEIYAKAKEVNGTATPVKVKMNNWVVSGVNGDNVYVTDGTKGFIIYTSGHGFAAGDILSGTVTTKIKMFNNSAEFVGLKSTTTGLTVTKGGTAVEQNISIADLEGINTGALLSYEKLTYHLNGTNAEFSDGENVIVAYKGIMNALPELVEGKAYNVKGVFLMYGTKKEILPRSAEDIVLIEDINSYTVTFGETINGTIAVKNGETVINSDDEVEEGTELTIECTPANADYRFKNWQYKEGEGSWNTRYTNPQGYTMPSANVQFRANFELIPTYTVAWSVNGTVVKTENLKEGEAITAPKVNDINGKTFTGWVTTPTVKADKEPTYEKLSATDNRTYYAVFADKSGSGEAKYTKVTKVEDITECQYVLATYDGAYYIANTETSNNKAPVVQSVPKDNSVNEDMLWTLSGNNTDGYEFTSVSNVENKLWGSNTNDGVRIASTCTKSGATTKWFVTSTDDYGLVIYNNSNSSSKRFLSTYGEQDWRNYTSTSSTNEAANLYKYESGASYSDFTTIPKVIFTPAGTIKISGNGGEGDYYATFSSDKIVAIPTDPSDDVTIDVQAVYVNAADGTLTMTDLYEEFYCTNEEMNKIIIPANTGVLIHAFTTAANVAPEVAIEYTNAESETSEYDPDFNMLRAGTVAKETDGSYKFYKLAYKQGTNQDPTTLGFYYGATDGAAFNSNPNLAYLAVPKTASAPIGFRIKDDATSIMNVENKVQNNTVYNLAGQRVASKNFKGIVIVNGKKMLNK